VTKVKDKQTEHHRISNHSHKTARLHDRTHYRTTLCAVGSCGVCGRTYVAETGCTVRRPHNLSRPMVAVA